jgi:hypothetical protein
MRYLMFIKMAEDHPMPPPQALMDAMDEHIAKGFASGTLLDTGGLSATADSTQYQVRSGTLTVTDGPFTEAKEVVGGFGLIQVDTEEEAHAAAREMIDLHQRNWPEWEGTLEVRRIFGPRDPA